MVGAKLAFQNEIPWQVTITLTLYRNNLLETNVQVSLLHSDGTWAGCGAALLSCSPLIVVTAAHCVRRSGYSVRHYSVPTRFEGEEVGLHLGFGSHVLDPSDPARCCVGALQ